MMNFTSNGEKDMNSSENMACSAEPKARFLRQKSEKLFNHLMTRRMYHCNLAKFSEILRDHEPFLDRINLMKRLPVHTGCVNTVHWNRTGEYILSGSDDRHLCITKPSCLLDMSEDYAVLQKFPTKHLGNIFSAKFLPNSGDFITVSCSSNGPVMVHDLNLSDPTRAIFTFNCHSSTIYDVVPLHDTDRVFLSCSEDSSVRLFDIRCHRSCSRPGTCPHPPLIKNSHAITTISVHPTVSNLILLGRADGKGLVYDRRKLPNPSNFSREKAHAQRIANEIDTDATMKYLHPLDGVISRFFVPDMKDPCRFTSLRYSPSGEQVLASYIRDDIYLFNHDRSSNFDYDKSFKKDPTDPTYSNPGISNHMSRELSKTVSNRPLRIRIRSNWSDTGINSTPDQARESSATTENIANRALRLFAVRDGSPSVSPALAYPLFHEDLARFRRQPIEISNDASSGYEQDNPSRDPVSDDSDRREKPSAENKDKPQISEKTRMKFRAASEALKNRFSQIQTYQPCRNYFGHRNSRTMIKQANFWGDNYIMSGSDCGRVFFWNKKTGKIVTAFPADNNVVNCLEPHPFHYVLATSGIDHDVKLWSTQFQSSPLLKPDASELERIVENNELMLKESMRTIALTPHLLFRYLFG